jgi:hypothetical protein
MGQVGPFVALFGLAVVGSEPLARWAQMLRIGVCGALAFGGIALYLRAKRIVAKADRALTESLVLGDPVALPAMSPIESSAVVHHRA